MLLLLMVKHITNFNTFIPTCLNFVLQTLDEVSYVEIIKVKLIIEVMILRQENEGKFWLIISCSFKMPGIGIKIGSTADMFDRVFIIAFKDTITTIRG